MIRNLQFKYLVAGLFLIASALLGYFVLSHYSPSSGKVDALSILHNAKPIEQEFDQDLQARIAKHKLAAAGTYDLQKIFQAPDGDVLDSKGNSVKLSELTTGKYTLLTFFYDMCADANGCPYAFSTMHIVKNFLERTPALSKQVRFLSISFDPARDTPMMMAGLEKRVNRNNKDFSIDWRYLTTKNVDTLIPLIDAYGQNVDVAFDAITGQRKMEFPHVLKIYLIDPKGFIREIYSTTFLSPEMLLNDIETLMIETEKGV
jgi:protein SCO1